MIASLPRRLAADRAGTSVVEFAIVVPVMLTLVMGLGELAYQGYAQSVLTGAVQKAGRDSTIQGANVTTAQIDAVVMAQLTQLRSGWTSDCSGAPPANSPTYCATRKSYSTYGQIAPEPFTDSNNNGQYDAATECFTDTNGNGTWDADPGTTGQGGANDVVVYTMTITYPRIFPVFGLIGLSKAATLNGSTTLKNQPWATQVTYTARQICP